MEIEGIRKELNHLLENVVEHSSRYSEERPIPSLEIGFVLSKINKMQENLSILRHLLEEKEKASKKARTAERKALVTEEIQKEAIVVEPVEEKEELPFLSEMTEDVQEKQPEVVQPIIETTEEEVSSTNENLEQPPISKLIDALTLNDRYLYANELFNKDMNAFNELVKSIDSSSSLNEAKELFSSLDWDGENDHVLSFTILVERRFS